jgi:hypothetical protein
MAVALEMGVVLVVLTETPMLLVKSVVAFVEMK